jgi:hypothetical protein
MGGSKMIELIRKTTQVIHTFAVKENGKEFLANLFSDGNGRMIAHNVSLDGEQVDEEIAEEIVEQIVTAYPEGFPK